MTTTERIKAWANKNYETSYGASALVDTYTDDELAKEFASLADAKAWAKLHDEAYAEVRAEAGEW